MALIDIFKGKDKDKKEVIKRYIPYKENKSDRLNFSYAFYQRNLRRLVISCIAVGIVNIFLGSYAINLYYSKSNQTYYATTYEGQLEKLKPVEYKS